MKKLLAKVMLGVALMVAGFSLNTAQTVWIPATGGYIGYDHLNGGWGLPQGYNIMSGNGQYSLTQQSDGNTVLYHNGSGMALWWTGSNTPGDYIIMQSDGNLVVYSGPVINGTCPSNCAIWNTGTAGNPGAYVVLQNDGNLVLYTASGGYLWSSGTYPHANTLQGLNGLNTSVGVYNDCTGKTVLPSAYAAVDPCINGRTYFVGHNAGVFTPLISYQNGQHILYTDGNQNRHDLTITRIIDNQPGNQLLGNIGLFQFQTCETAYPGGQFDRILDAS